MDCFSPSPNTRKVKAFTEDAPKQYTFINSSLPTMLDPDMHTMAPFRDIEVVVQQFEPASNTWRPLQESNDQRTLRPEKNSAARQTVILESRQGRFRFAIRVSNHLKWGSANGLVVNLTFDEGWQVKDYPVTIFKPGVDVLALLGTAPTPGIGILQASEHDLKLEYMLDAIALPRKMTEPGRPWYSTKFAFRKLKFGGVNPHLRPPYVSPTDLAKLLVVVQPCCIHGVSTTRLAALSFKPDGGQRNQSRNFAAQSGITLETTIKQTPQDKSVSQVPEILSRPIAPHEKRTFVFLYREPDYYDKIDDVEVIDRTHSKTAAPCSDPSPTQLADSLFGSDSISDVENRTPRRTRNSSNRSSARAYKQRPSSAASATTASTPILSSHADFLPIPVYTENDSGSLADPTSVPARQETADTTSANLIYSSPRLEGQPNGHREEAVTTDGDTIVDSSKKRLDRSTGHSRLTSSDQEGLPENAGVLAHGPLTTLAPLDRLPQAWGPLGTLKRSELLRHRDQQEDDIEAEIQEATSQYLQRREEIGHESVYTNDKVHELKRQLHELIQHLDGLEKEDAEIARDLAALSNISQTRTSGLEQEEIDAFKKIEENQLKELSGIRDFIESAKKTWKRRRSQCSADSTPNNHRAPKRHAPAKPMDGDGDGAGDGEGRRTDDDVSRGGRPGAS